MSNITVKGKNIHVTEPIHDYAVEKMNKGLKNFEEYVMDLTVVLSVNKNRSVTKNQIAEVTVAAKGGIDSMYSALDLVSDKIARQLRKYKSRIIDKSHHKGEAKVTSPSATPVESEYSVVRNKVFDLNAMSVEAAIHQMDLLGHPFFVFLNSDTKNISIVYHREDGQYGLMEPKIAGQ
jgi:putative sigma-54 modulation protein